MLQQNLIARFCAVLHYRPKNNISCTAKKGAFNLFHVNPWNKDFFSCFLFFFFYQAGFDNGKANYIYTAHFITGKLNKFNTKMKNISRSEITKGSIDTNTFKSLSRSDKWEKPVFSHRL